MTNPSEQYYPPEAGYLPDDSGAPDQRVVVEDPPPADPPPASTGGSGSTTDVAKSEASDVKDTAVGAGKDVAATAKDQAANVVGETKQQAKGLLDSVSGELKSQAATQQQNVASSVHALSKELGGMASGSSESGPLTDLAHQGAAKGGEIAHWLQDHEPRDLLREVTDFGRRRPVAFLALCGLAGVIAGRLTRGAVAANTSVDSAGSSAASSDDRSLVDETYGAGGGPYVDPYVDPNRESDYTAARAYQAPTTSVGPDDQFGTPR